VPIDPREWLEQHGLAEAGSADQSVRQLSEPSNDDADAESVARSIALRKLTARPRTRHELDQALQAKNVPPSVKKAVLDRMQEVGLVDDASLQLTGLPRASSAAISPAGRLGGNWSQKGWNGATSIAHLTMSISIQS
jgi:hypothetical protein